MSIDHKAYPFRYDAFRAELADLLYACLDSGQVEPLRDFIERHRATLTDQGTMQPPADDWEAKLGKKQSVQRYADLALSRYYDVTRGGGLSYGFDALARYLHTVPGVAGQASLLICGRLFGPKGKRLDPGLMGTGLLSPAEVARLARLLDGTAWPPIPGPESAIYAECHYAPASAGDVQESLDELRGIYRGAAAAGAGLLLADYNDAGVGRL